MASNEKKSIRLSKAFTLIELLVVIAIISLLVSILLPSLKQAKSLAQTAVCANDLKGYGLTTALFTEEYDGHYPQHSIPQGPHYYWSSTLPRAGFDSLPGRAINIYHDDNSERGCSDNSQTTPDAPAMYSEHYVMYNHALWAYAAVNTIPDPMKTVAWADGYRNAAGLWVCQWDNAEYWSVYPNIGDWHDGAANLCFTDGHVEKLKKNTENMTSDMWKVYDGNRATVIEGWLNFPVE